MSDAPPDAPPAEFAHLEPNSEPKTADEAFWMAAQWGNRWSNWNTISQNYPTSEAGPAISSTAQADAAEAQRLVAIGMGLTFKEHLGDLVFGLGGIEERLSEIRDRVGDS